jgi:hypothetical protein
VCSYLNKKIIDLKVFVTAEMCFKLSCRIYYSIVSTNTGHEDKLSGDGVIKEIGIFNRISIKS